MPPNPQQLTMSRYTEKQLQESADNLNAELERLGINLRYTVGGRYEHAAIDAIDPRSDSGAILNNVELGTPRECNDTMRRHYAFEIANHYRNKWEAIAPPPAVDAPPIPQWVEGATLAKLPAKSPFDCKGPRSVTAYALLWQGQPAGKIVAHHGDASCTAGVWVHKGPLQHLPSVWATVTGCGYDRFSSAVCKALGNAVANAGDSQYAYDREPKPDSAEPIGLAESVAARNAILATINRLDGAGESRVCRWFEQFGYVTTQVV